MRIVRKWFSKRKNSFPIGRKKKRVVVVVDKEVQIDLESKINSNLQILNNQTKIMDEKEQLVDPMKSTPYSYHDGNCVCLFIMLVFYYLSIITTKFKNTLQENINSRKN